MTWGRSVRRSGRGKASSSGDAARSAEELPAVDEPVIDPGVVARNRRRRLLLGTVVSFAVMFMGVVVLPTRAWLGQQQDLAAAKAELRQVKVDNKALGKEVDRLGDDASIERQARRDLGLVKPGEESYTVTAARPPEVNMPDVWPFSLLQDSLAQAATRPRDDG